MTSLPKSFIPDTSDLLYQDLENSLDQYAEMAGLFESNGPGGCCWELDRKSLLSELKEAIRADSMKPMTDGRADDLAHIHPTYRAYVNEGKKQRKEYHRIKAIRTDHYAKLRSNDRKGML